MPKYIVINGDKAWVSDYTDITQARVESNKICDTEEELLVRPIDKIRDHTKPQDDSGLMTREEIQEWISDRRLTFTEASSRMNYGLIGGLFSANCKSLVSIYPKCFYVRSVEFALNEDSLILIKSIQVRYEHLNPEK